MFSRALLGRFAFGGLAVLAAAAVLSVAPPVLEGQDEKGGAPQVLTRGPIHEAFAEPVTFDPKPGPTAPKQPPALVEEVPPDQKPEGDNVAWITGYWQWEDDRKDFVWVSGFWRVMPPGRKWVPGYWMNQDDGTAQWVGGYWAGADQGQVEYLPAPPQTLENGAPTQAPTADHVWTPGVWVWQTNRYLWRPGFWVVSQPGWIWTPAYYAWSPCGYVYVDGYWDWSIRRRGVIFAPCYWSAWTYRPVYVYRPTVCIDVDIMTDHFFCRTGYSSYYFGDYYGGTYVSLGFTPWFSFHYGRGGGYCPIYAYNAWYYRSNPRWQVELRAGYDYRFRHLDARPPRTYVAQQNIINVNINKTVVNNNTTIVNRNVVAKPITQIAADSAKAKDAPMRFSKIDAAQVKQFKDQGMASQKFVAERGSLEKQAARQMNVAGGGRNVGVGGAGAAGVARGGKAAGPQQPMKLDLPKSAVIAKQPASGGAAAGAGGAKETIRSDGTKLSNQPPDRPRVGGRPDLPKIGSGAGGASGAGDAGKVGTGAAGGAGGAGAAGGAGTRLPAVQGSKDKDPVKLPTTGGATGGAAGGTPRSLQPTGPMGGKPPISGGGSGSSGGASSGGAGGSGRQPINPPSGGGKPPSSGGTAGSGSGKPPLGGGSGSGQRPPGGGGSGGSSGSGSGSSKKDKDKGGL